MNKKTSTSRHARAHPPSHIHQGPGPSLPPPLNPPPPSPLPRNYCHPLYVPMPPAPPRLNMSSNSSKPPKPPPPNPFFPVTHTHIIYLNNTSCFFFSHDQPTSYRVLFPINSLPPSGAAAMAWSCYGVELERHLPLSETIKWSGTRITAASAAGAKYRASTPMR
jgi:hypothetical protein